MTSKLTRERIELIANFHRAMALPPSHAEIEELARMALAAMESEPVAWTWHYREQWHVTNDKCRAEFVAKDGDVAVLPLYRHAQPAPVVLEEATPENVEMLSGYISTYKLTDSERDIAAEIWNACRAAMLAADPQSPGSEPATMPGKWIPVGERMPEDEQEVLTINRMGHCFVSFFDKHSGLFFDRIDAPAACCIEHVLVTHWMPLPATPQEVKGE